MKRTVVRSELLRTLLCLAAIVIVSGAVLFTHVRETPLHTGHLRNLVTLSELGAVIAPPVPAFYTQPGTLDELVDQTVVRLLDQLGIHEDVPTRWRGLTER